MTLFTKVIDVAAPRAFCFEFVRQFDHARLWDPALKGAEQLSGGRPPQVGDRFGLYAGALGLQFELPYTIVDLREHSLLALAGETAIFSYHDKIQFSDLPGTACRIQYDASFTLRGLLRIASPIAGCIFNQLGKLATRDMASVIEAHHRAEAEPSST